MARTEIYADQFDPKILENLRKAEFDEVSDFRRRMKATEEFATSGNVTRPGAEIAGRRVRIAHRMGDRFDVQVRDPFTKQMQTVVSHQYDLRGRHVGIQVAWQPGDPNSVAAAFGIPFVSAFGDTPRNPSADEQERSAVERAVSKARTDYKIRKAVELEQKRLEEMDAQKSKGKKKKAPGYVSDPSVPFGK